MDTLRPDWEITSTSNLAATVVMAIAALGAIIYVYRVWREEKNPYPWFILLGSTITILYEPLADVLGLCTYPEIHQMTLIETFGRKIPLYTGFVYVFYFCAPTVFVMRQIDKGVDAARWWKFYIIGTIAAASFEFIPIQLGWWFYYGDHQPLTVFHFPMRWWFNNAAVIAGMATVLQYMNRRVLTRQTAPLLILLTPMTVMGFDIMAGFPTYTALHSTDNMAINNAAAVLAIGFDLFIVWLTGNIVARQSSRHEKQAWLGDVKTSG